MRTPRFASALVALLVLASCSSSSKNPAASNSATTRPASSAPQQTTASGISPVLASWHLPTALSREVAVATDAGRLVVLGGLQAGGASSKAVVAIDPTSGVAETIGALADPVHDAGGVVLSGRFVVFGGGETKTVDTVQSFAPGSSPERSGKLPAPRSDLAAVAIGDRAYIAGGYDGQTLLAAVISTADGTHFETVSSLPVPVRYAATVADGNAIYLFGGTTGRSDVATIQVVDVAAKRSRVAGHLPRALAHAGAAVVGGGIYVFGGRRGSAAVDAIYRFDPATGAVTEAGRLPAPESDFAVASIGGAAYLLGGEQAGGRQVARVIRLAR